MKQIIDKETLQHIASLARLEIAPGEETQLLSDLEKILAYVAQLGSVDTSAALPAHAVMNELRSDKPQEGLTREQGLGQAPAAKNGFVVVQNVMGGDDEE